MGQESLREVRTVWERLGEVRDGPGEPQGGLGWVR